MSIPRVLEPEVMDTLQEAVDYDAMDHSGANQQFVQDLLTFLGSRAEKLLTGAAGILDLGTGTARIPVLLRTYWKHPGPLLACDLSGQMLRLAARNVAGAKFTKAILPIFADCKQLPVATAGCDLVISNSIVHHIPDPLQVFREMARVSCPGGGLFVRDLMRPNSPAEIDQLVKTYAGSENPHQQQMFRDSLHAALTVAEVRTLLRKAGLNASWVSQTSDRHWTVAGIVSR